MTARPALILSASIGEGHDLPARVLADELRSQAPGMEVRIVDALALLNPVARRLAVNAASYDTELGSRLFDLSHSLISDVRPTRALTSRLIEAASTRRLMALIEAEPPVVVVATYPGASEVLGRLRLRGALDVPVASAITDLAALRYWAHPGVDLHLITHPESEHEVHAIASGTRVVAVRGLTSPSFLTPPDRTQARQRLGFPADRRVVVVSGGGWAVGDLDGALDCALKLEGTLAVALCGRKEGVRERLELRYRGNDRVRVLGFVEGMADLLAAADALVHSTAGLTVLEALMLGCPTVSYGWGRGHIRANNRAFERFGLAEVAADRTALRGALARALERRGEPDASFAALPSAASLVLELARPGGGVVGAPDQLADRA